MSLCLSIFSHLLHPHPHLSTSTTSTSTTSTPCRQYVEYVKNLRHIQVRGDGSATFELEVDLKDPSSRIFLYKIFMCYFNTLQDGVMIPFFDIAANTKHSLKTVGKKLVFSINNLMAEDAGLYQVDVEGVNLFSTDFKSKVPNVKFVVKIQEVTAQERENAVFECVLSHPLPRVKWIGKNSPLEDGDKYTITASEDKLIHSLLVKDCKQLDKGIYTAVAGIKSCSAWLIVQGTEAAHQSPGSTTHAARKTTAASGTDVDLSKVAEEQRLRLQEERERERMEAEAMKAQREAELLELNVASSSSAAGAGPAVADGLHPGVQFVSGLSDVDAILGGTAEIMCKVSSEDYPPRFDEEDLSVFSRPVVIKVGQNAVFKLPFEGQEPMKMQWFRDGEELLADANVKIERWADHSRLLLSRCQRKDAGEIKFRLRNDHGTTEVVSQLVVIDRPSIPQGPAEVLESSPAVIEFKWRPPKDDGGRPVVSYALERRQVGRNTWKKLADVPGGVPGYRDTDVDHGRKYCYQKTYAVKDVVESLEYEFRVAAVNSSGAGEFSNPSEFVFARDPKKPPGKVLDLKVTDRSYTHLSLSWGKPEAVAGLQDEAKGYHVELRPADSLEWCRCNATASILPSYSVKGLRAMEMYWVRVVATNEGGEGAAADLPTYVLVMPLPGESPEVLRSHMMMTICRRFLY
ncbi:hypothetical protein CRUP_037295 [Coryphaenoides rupestris]|nr:hypothetical protein CRUP_037295 [Coryphaenoides rupestris]